jgi:glycosyltransferase involved in cell wall biosynthesis
MTIMANCASPIKAPSPERSTRARVPERVPARIALFTNYIPPYLLPVLRCLANSVERLQVIVSTPMEADRPWKPSWDGLDVTVQKSITRTSRRVYKQGYSMTFFRHFPYDSLPLLYNYKPDVVVSSQLGFRTMQAAVYRLLNSASRLILWVDASEHTEVEIGHAQTLIRKLLVRCADAVIVNGSSGSRYVQTLGVSPDKIILAPYVSNIAEVSAAASVDLPNLTRRLLYVGQLIERKGLQRCFQELARWAERHGDKNCELTLVGDGPLRETLERFPMPPNVKLHFIGNVDYSGLAPYYANAGIFVLPCLADTWGLVVNEALAAGLPVLGSLYSQAVEELVQDGVNGWTCYVDRQEHFQEALERALSTSLSSLTRMKEHARASARSLTPEYAAGQFVQAIRVATRS